VILTFKFFPIPGGIVQFNCESEINTTEVEGLFFFKKRLVHKETLCAKPEFDIKTPKTLNLKPKNDL
jgi:hypothetical protein